LSRTQAAIHTSFAAVSALALCTKMLQELPAKAPKVE